MMIQRHDPIKVLHVIGSLSRGGVETWLMYVLRQIECSVFQFDFCCLSGEEGVYASEAKELGSNVHTIHLTPNLLAFNRQFTRLLNEQDYDIVHSHVHHFSGYILRLAYKSGIPIRIAHSHNDTSFIDGQASFLRKGYLRFTEYLVKKYATDGFACSRKASSALYGEKWEEDRRWQVLYCGVDLEPFGRLGEPRHTRDELGIPLDALVVGHVGRFNGQKNHSFVIDIAMELIRKEPNVWLLLVGDGPLRPDIENKVSSLGLNKRVIFTGLRPDVPRLMRAMDLFVMPSIHEGLPVTGIEAQAAGLRCLFSDAITPEVEIVPGAVEFLPLHISANEWAQKILSILAGPQVDLPAALQAVSLSPFAIENSVRALTQIYEESLT